MDLSPVYETEEADSTGSSDGKLLEFLVDTDALNRVVTNLRLEELLAGLSRLSRDHADDTRAEAHDDLVVIIPLESESLAKVVMELEEEVFLVLRPQIEQLLAGNDGSDAPQRLVGVLVGRPLNLVDFTTDDERVVDGVTSCVRYGEDLVLRARNEIAFTVPVSARHFLAVLRHARDLALVLPVEEDDRTLV